MIFRCFLKVYYISRNCLFSLHFLQIMFKNRLYRQKIAAETQSYFPEITKHYDDRIPFAVKKTKYYSNLPSYSMEMQNVPNERRHANGEIAKTKYRIFQGDTVDVALKLKASGFNPCVLNMASYKEPGGRWKNGASAQEEAIFLRSTYDLSLSDPFKFDKERYWNYPLEITSGIYSPDVLIFRKGMKDDYEVLEWKDCKFLNFVAVAALKKPKLSIGERGRREMNQHDVNITAEKIRTILRISLVNNHHHVLLGAFGCGAYGNPSWQIAELFFSILKEPEFYNRFSYIDFAILDTNPSENNYEIFRGCLGKFLCEESLVDRKSSRNIKIDESDESYDRAVYLQFMKKFKKPV